MKSALKTALTLVDSRTEKNGENTTTYPEHIWFESPFSLRVWLWLRDRYSDWPGHVIAGHTHGFTKTAACGNTFISPYPFVVFMNVLIIVPKTLSLCFFLSWLCCTLHAWCPIQRSKKETMSAYIKKMVTRVKSHNLSLSVVVCQSSGSRTSSLRFRRQGPSQPGGPLWPTQPRTELHKKDFDTKNLTIFRVWEEKVLGPRTPTLPRKVTGGQEFLSTSQYP